MSALGQLQELQLAFRNHVLAQDSTIATHIISTADVDAATRLDVYAAGYRLRLVEVLEHDFPGVRALLSAPQFDVLARGYIETHPSAHYSLRWYGQYFATHIATLPIHETRPELAEMARFEWCWGECFDAADATPIDMEALAALPPNAWLDLTLDFLPGIRNTNVKFNTVEMWQAAKQESTLQTTQRLSAATEVLLWRHALNVRWRSLERDETAAINAARDGADFPQLCDTLIAAGIAEDDVPLRAATLIKRWLHEGLIRALRTNGGVLPHPT